MERREFVRGVGAVSLLGTTALAGCSALEGERSSGGASDDTVTANVGGKELWMRHERANRGPGSTSVINFWPEGAWIDDNIEPRIDADSDDIELGDSLADLPVSEITSVLDGIRTWAVFAVDLSTPDAINGNERVDGDGEYYWYAGPTAFIDRVDVGSEYGFRVAEPDEYYDGAGHGRVVDIVD